MWAKLSRALALGMVSWGKLTSGSESDQGFKDDNDMVNNHKR